MKIRATVMVLVMGCASARPLPARAPLVPVGEVALPPRPDAQPIAAAEQWVVPMEQGQCATRAGIQMSMANAQRAAQWRIGYDEIRGLYEVDRRTWVAQTAVFVEGLRTADREIERLRPTWFEQHSGQIGLATGLFLGAVLAVGIAAAIHQVAP